MKRVAFDVDGQRYEARVLARKKHRARVGWPEQDVPPALANRVKASDTRTGWKTLLLTISGPDAVTLHDLPGPSRPARTGGRAQGVRTAELAKQFGLYATTSGRSRPCACSVWSSWPSERLTPGSEATGVSRVLIVERLLSSEQDGQPPRRRGGSFPHAGAAGSARRSYRGSI